MSYKKKNYLRIKCCKIFICKASQVVSTLFSMNYFYNFKNYILIGIIVILIPFAYAKNQDDEDMDIIAMNTFIGPMEEIKFIPIDKVKRGVIKSVDRVENTFIIQMSTTTSLRIETTATTTFSEGENLPISFYDINPTMKVYIFGYMKSDNSAMLASKIIVAHKSRLERK